MSKRHHSRQTSLTVGDLVHDQIKANYAGRIILQPCQHYFTALLAGETEPKIFGSTDRHTMLAAFLRIKREQRQ